jgi:ATP-dependent RNA helicase DeaD
VGYKVPSVKARAAVLQAVLELEDPEAAIIFVQTRKEAADLTHRLQTSGYSVDEYHGDLTQSQRERLLVRFRNRQVRWVIATDIAARGIHVDDLTHVINYDVPDNTESYVHRIGRTGRAGNEGTAITLIHSTERWALRQIERHVKQEIEILPTPSRSQIEARRLEKLTSEVHDSLMGERLASFLPIVAQLGEDYDMQAIAAAALQMAFDRYPPVSTQLEAATEAPERKGGSRQKPSPPQIAATSKQ